MKEPGIATEIGMIAFIFVGTIASWIVLTKQLKALHDEHPVKKTILNATEQKALSVEFLLSYILPLFAFDFTKWDQVVLFGFFFVIVGYLCISHNMYCANLVLDVMKYRFYDCEIENADGISSTIVIISQRPLTSMVKQQVPISTLNNDYSFDTIRRS